MFDQLIKVYASFCYFVCKTQLSSLVDIYLLTSIIIAYYLNKAAFDHILYIIYKPATYFLTFNFVFTVT